MDSDEDSDLGASSSGGVRGRVSLGRGRRAIDVEHQGGERDIEDQGGERVGGDGARENC